MNRANIFRKNNSFGCRTKFFNFGGKSKKSILEEYLGRYEKVFWNYRKIDSGGKNEARNFCYQVYFWVADTDLHVV